jgi:RNA methyltransferase, TrmH family
LRRSSKKIRSTRSGEAARWASAGETLLILDGIGNPHNLGAIARSAAFFGLKRLALSDHLAQALPSDAAYRIAEGGLEHLALYRAAGLPALLHRLARDFRIIGTAAQGGTPLAALAASPRPAALVLGNEETGLARATLDACAEIVTIPAGGAVQSLNVSVSAGILLFALRRP